MKTQEIKAKIEAHQKWLNGDKEGIRADFTKADLTNADLTNADLTGADLKGARIAQGWHIEKD